MELNGTNWIMNRRFKSNIAHIAAMQNQMKYVFEDGIFVFWVATYGSWANDKRIVFRVRLDTLPTIRAEQKGIKHYDRLFPAWAEDISAWGISHSSYKVIDVCEGY